MTVLALIGGGRMGEAIMAGLLDAGWSSDRVVVSERSSARGAFLTEKYGVVVVSSEQAASQADVVLLAVKPQDVGGALEPVRAALRPGAMVLSILVGITTKQLERLLPDGTPVVRAMPNLPASVRVGMTAVSAGTNADEEQVSLAASIMSSVGSVVVVDEKYQNAVGAISGSGPAYLFLVAEAMIDAGVEQGLPRDVVKELTIETLFGSAKLLRDSDHSPAELREHVTSPGGTTAAALRQFEDRGIRASFLAAVEAAAQRSRALQADLG